MHRGTRGVKDTLLPLCCLCRGNLCLQHVWHMQVLCFSSPAGCSSLQLQWPALPSPDCVFLVPRIPANRLKSNGSACARFALLWLSLEPGWDLETGSMLERILLLQDTMDPEIKSLARVWSHFWGRSFPVAAWKQVMNTLSLSVLPIWYFSVTHSSKGKCSWQDSKHVPTVGTRPQFAVLYPCCRWRRVWHKELKGRSHHSWSRHWTAAFIQTIVYQDGVGSGKQKLLDALRTQATVPRVGGHRPLLLTAPHARAS